MIVEPTSKADALRVLAETGVASVFYRTVKRRAIDRQNSGAPSIVGSIRRPRRVGASVRLSSMLEQRTRSAAAPRVSAAGASALGLPPAGLPGMAGSRRRMMQTEIATHSSLERLSIMPVPCRAEAGVLLVVLLDRCTRLANCTHDAFTPCGPDRIAGGHRRAGAGAGCHRSGPAPELPDPVLRVESGVGVDSGVLCGRFRCGTPAESG
jgi:hypothetical protein